MNQMQAILDFISNRRGVSVDDIRGPRCFKKMTRARHEFIWLMRNLTNQSNATIGWEIGGRSGVSVGYGRSRVEAYMALDEGYRSEMLVMLRDAGRVLNPSKNQPEDSVEPPNLSKVKSVGHGDQMETVSYHLPVEMIEEITELASLRLRRDKLARRAAKASGQKVEGQARRSGSAVVREAVAVHMPEILKEIEALREELGIARPKIENGYLEAAE